MSDPQTLNFRRDGRIGRITLDRPDRGNGITLQMPVELAAAVEEANLDPAVHVIALAGNGTGFCGGYDLTAAEDMGSGRAAGEGAADPGAPNSPGVVAANHDPSGTWDPVVDWQMMSPEPPRVHVAVPFRQARDLQDPRLLHRRRDGHGALLGPDRRRGPGEDRLPAGTGVGSADLDALGAPGRSRAGPSPAADRRLDRRDDRRRMGPRQRGGPLGTSSTSASSACSSESGDCRSISWSCTSSRSTRR